MGSRHLSLRIDPDLYSRLEEESAANNESVSELARTLIEEGLRMAAHPGIFFNPGPTGRRAHLMGGPDVWELISIYNQLREPGVDAVALTAVELGIHPYVVDVAVRYYAAYPDEIDSRIESNRIEGEKAYAAWLKEQSILAR